MVERIKIIDTECQKTIGKVPDHLWELLDDNSDTPLSTYLLQESPLVFKLLLLQRTRKKYPQVIKLWSKLYSEGIFDIETIKVHRSNWRGNAGWASGIFDGELNIGCLPIPSLIRDQMIFFDKAFNYEDEIIWKFSHEMSHIVAHNLVRYNVNVRNLFNNVILPSRNSHEGRGLSLIGGLQLQPGVRFYRNRGGGFEQATEDITELINMYLISPEYLKNSLELMRDMDDEWLSKYGLLRLDNNGIAYIFNTIKEGVDRWL